jgi:hypothetical protein
VDESTVACGEVAGGESTVACGESTKHQRNTKLQAPIPYYKDMPRVTQPLTYRQINVRTCLKFGAWFLELLWCLELGAWSFRRRRRSFRRRRPLPKILPPPSKKTCIPPPLIPALIIVMIDCHGFTSPARRCPLHERDATSIRCFKGADNGAAIKEQRLAREQSAAQFKEQMALMRQQYEDAQKVKPPVYAPAAPLASASPDAYNAGLDAQRAAKRRFGSAATNLSALRYRPAAAGPVSLTA